MSHNRTKYGSPVIGYADAKNSLFHDLKELVDPDHLLPQDLLPAGKTVVAFYLPFSPEIIQVNLEHQLVAPAWAIAYQETNKLLEHICKSLSDRLSYKGIKSAFVPPTHNFHREKLISFWSHKHVGYICGLGSFGFHHMLITDRGCAGRLTSLVIDYPIDSSSRRSKAYCLYSRNGGCRRCVEVCPSQSLSNSGLDREACYTYLLKVDAHLSGRGSLDICGKCACACPFSTVPKI